MAYRIAQLDEHVTDARARKVAKRSASRKTRQTIRQALRKGMDAIDSAISNRRGHTYAGYES